MNVRAKVRESSRVMPPLSHENDRASFTDYASASVEAKRCSVRWRKLRRHKLRVRPRCAKGPKNPQRVCSGPTSFIWMHIKTRRRTLLIVQKDGRWVRRCPSPVPVLSFPGVLLNEKETLPSTKGAVRTRPNRGLWGRPLRPQTTRRRRVSGPAFPRPRRQGRKFGARLRLYFRRR